MSTNWRITTAADRITLDEAMRGETTFTVTNPGTAMDRAVFEAVPGEGADASWFAVDEPQRRVPGGGSVSYVLKVALPPGAPAGSYTVHGRVYSADTAPEESSVLSGRLAIEVKSVAVPERKPRPWWLLAVAGLFVIVLGVVLWLVFRGGDEPATTAGGGGTGEMVSVPDVSRQSESAATTNLKVAGLSVGTVRHKQDAQNVDSLLYQSVAPGSRAPRGSRVDLVVTANIAAPTFTAPAQGAILPRSAFARPITPVPRQDVASPTPTAGASPSPGGDAAPRGVFQWTQKEAHVTRWLVTVRREMCGVQNIALGPATTSICGLDAPTSVVVDTNSATPLISMLDRPGTVALFTTGTVQVTVSALDDFGNAGAGATLTVGVR